MSLAAHLAAQSTCVHFYFPFLFPVFHSNRHCGRRAAATLSRCASECDQLEDLIMQRLRTQPVANAGNLFVVAIVVVVVVRLRF